MLTNLKGTKNILCFFFFKTIFLRIPFHLGCFLTSIGKSCLSATLLFNRHFRKLFFRTHPLVIASRISGASFNCSRRGYDQPRTCGDLQEHHYPFGEKEDRPDGRLWFSPLLGTDNTVPRCQEYSHN